MGCCIVRVRYENIDHSSYAFVPTLMRTVEKPGKLATRYQQAGCLVGSEQLQAILEHSSQFSASPWRRVAVLPQRPVRAVADASAPLFHQWVGECPARPLSSPGRNAALTRSSHFLRDAALLSLMNSRPFVEKDVQVSQAPRSWTRPTGPVCQLPPSHHPHSELPLKHWSPLQQRFVSHK